MSVLLDDLNAQVNKAIDETLEPLHKQREQIVAAIDVEKNELRELEAQLQRVDRMLEAGRLRKKPGRPAGSVRPKATAKA